jgi:hypothetical protein
MMITMRKKRIDTSVNGEITGKSSREQAFDGRYMFVFVTLIPVLLWLLIAIFPADKRESIELAVPIAAMVLSIWAGSFIKAGSRELSQRAQLFLIVLTTLGVAFQSAISGKGKFPYLWNGFGVKLIVSALLATALLTTRYPYQILTAIRDRSLLEKFLSAVGLFIFAFVYLPALIQPSWGIINIGDATHQVLEEISGPIVGNFPGVNAVSTYTTMLGVPLTLLRLFNLGNQTQMSLVLVWVNLLVLAAPVFMVLTFRLISKSKNWFWSTMIVVPILMVSGSWSAASSNTESLSMIPGRTLLPIVLGFFLVRAVRLDDWKGNMRGAAFLGILGVIVAMNNIEFGVPALGAMVVVSLILALQLQGAVRFVCYLVTGAAVGFLLYVGYSLSIDGPYDLDFRIGSYAGKPYSPAELFPILSLHNVLLALFGSAIASGIIRLRNINLGNKTDGLVAAVCALYFGIWGFASFPYCSYRCVDGLYMSTQVYLIPSIMCGAALCVLQLPKLEVLRNESLWKRMSYTPYFFFASFALVSVLQAPNPMDEWNRVLNRAGNEQWASDPLRGPADQWNIEEIDWIRPIEISDLARKVNSNDIGYFGYMGNSVELATGLNNLTRINSGEVLLIKGTNRLNELACVGADETRPKFVVVYGIEFICEGYSPFDQVTSSVPGLGVYIRNG